MTGKPTIAHWLALMSPSAQSPMGAEALITFAKGSVGGALSAWKKPEPALALSKANLQFVLTKLP